MVCIFYNVIAIAAVTYCLLDVNYLIRTLFTTLWRKVIPRKRKRLSETVHTYGFCTINDADLFFSHMNNARYLRELDFSRLDFYHRTGLYDVILSGNGDIRQGATIARYRKPIPIFAFFQITTKLIYWDEKGIYLEHKFISVSDKFLRAIIVSRQNFPGLNISVSNMLKTVDPEIQQFEPAEDLKHFIKYNELCSQNWKKSD